MKRINCQPLIDAIDAYIAKADEELEGQLTMEGYADAAQTVKTVNEVEEAVTLLLESYGENLVKRLDKAVDLKTFFEEDWPKLKRGYPLGEQLQKAFVKRFKKAVRYFTKKYLVAVDPELKIATVTKRTLTWCEEWSGELSEIMKLNTNTKIEAVLKKGLEAGSSIEEISKAIAESDIRAPGYRARRVALTETLRAHSVAQQEAFMQNPAVTGKRWRHSGARRIKVRDNHVALSAGTQGKNVVPKDKPFELIGADGATYYPMYPRGTNLPPEESVNCHCVASPIVDDEVFALPTAKREALRRKAIKEMNDAWEAEQDAMHRAKAEAARAAAGK